MLISELASRTGLSTDTIRFYEKQGVLDASHSLRRSNNYRDYNERAVERLLLVKQAQLAGFTLSEVATSISDWEQDQISNVQKTDIFMQKIEQIDQRIADLQAIRSYLVAKIARMGQPDCRPVEEGVEEVAA